MSNATGWAATADVALDAAGGEKEAGEWHDTCSSKGSCSCSANGKFGNALALDTRGREMTCTIGTFTFMAVRYDMFVFVNSSCKYTWKILAVKRNMKKN